MPSEIQCDFCRWWVPEMAVLRTQFNKYFSLASGVLTSLLKLAFQKPPPAIYTEDAFTSWGKWLEARQNHLHKYGHISQFPGFVGWGMTHSTVLDKLCYFSNAFVAPATRVTHTCCQTAALRHLLATTWEKGQGTVRSCLFSGKTIYCLELQGQTLQAAGAFNRCFVVGCGQKPV